MAISSADITALTDYSFAEIKKACKVAMINGALGGATLSINGRMIGRFTPEQLQKLYQWADQRELEDSTTTPGGLVLVQYGERA